MPRLTWSPAAAHDLQRLYRFLAAKKPDAAKRAIRTIRSGVMVLRDHPEAGRPVVELGRQYREWIIDFGNGGYVARYSFEGHLVTVLRVRHGREESV